MAIITIMILIMMTISLSITTIIINIVVFRSPPHWKALRWVSAGHARSLSAMLWTWAPGRGSKTWCFLVNTRITGVYRCWPPPKPYVYIDIDRYIDVYLYICVCVSLSLCVQPSIVEKVLIHFRVKTAIGQLLPENSTKCDPTAEVLSKKRVTPKTVR